MKETIVKCNECKSKNISKIDSKVKEIPKYKDVGEWYMLHQEFSHNEYVKVDTYKCNECGHEFLEEE